MNMPYSETLPADLVHHVTETLGDTGREWLAELSRTIGTLANDWALTVGPPFEAGEFNFVAPAVYRGAEKCP